MLPTPLLALGLSAALGADGVATVRQGGAAATSAPAPRQVVWRAPSPAWSNASPVVWRGLACATAEPTTVWCVDAATGAPRWAVDVTYGDTLDAAGRTAWNTARDVATEARATATALQAEYARLRRELRRGELDPALPARLEDVAARLGAARAAAGVELHDAHEAREIIGWSSHPPVADAERLYVLFGQGVVAALSPTGARLWTVFTEPSPRPMRGYMLGSAAAPVLADGLLIVPQGHLRALDPATGRVVWTGPRYADFGTPALARVGGISVLLTPAGELVRVADGSVLQTGLDAPWFTGWHVDGTRAWVVGGQAGDVVAPDYTPTASAWTLSGDGATVRATRQWSVRLPSRERFYVPPTLDGSLLALGADGTPWRFDLATGAATAGATERLGTVYTAPLRTGSGVLVAGELGGLGVLGGPRLALEALRSTPVEAGGRWYVRTLEALWCLAP